MKNLSEVASAFRKLYAHLTHLLHKWFSVFLVLYLNEGEEEEVGKELLEVLQKL